MEPVTCYLAEAVFNAAKLDHERYYLAAGDEPAVRDAFVHFRTLQEELNRQEAAIPSVLLGRLRISRITLGGLDPARGGIALTIDHLLYDSDDVESSLVKELPEFITHGF